MFHRVKPTDEREHLTEKPKAKKSRFEGHRLPTASELQKVIAQKSREAHKKNRNKWEYSFHGLLFSLVFAGFACDHHVLFGARVETYSEMLNTGLFPKGVSVIVRDAFRNSTEVGIEFSGRIRILCGSSEGSERVLEFAPKRPTILFDDILAMLFRAGVTVALIE